MSHDDFGSFEISTADLFPGLSDPDMYGNWTLDTLQMLMTAPSGLAIHLLIEDHDEHDSNYHFHYFNLASVRPDLDPFARPRDQLVLRALAHQAMWVMRAGFPSIQLESFNGPLKLRQVVAIDAQNHAVCLRDANTQPSPAVDAASDMMLVAGTSTRARPIINDPDLSGDWILDPAHSRALASSGMILNFVYQGERLHRVDIPNMAATRPDLAKGAEEETDGEFPSRTRLEMLLNHANDLTQRTMHLRSENERIEIPARGNEDSKAPRGSGARIVIKM